MSYSIANFSADIALRLNKWANYAGATAEMTTLANTLSADQIAHDTTIITPMAPLTIGPPQTPFTNDINLIINRGKAGNLSGSAMANAMASLAGPPVNIVAPVVSGVGSIGSTLTCTTGTWQHFPSSYAFQWRRGGSNIPGATGAGYTTVAADGAYNLGCTVTATNSGGSAGKLSSNVILVAAAADP